MSYRPEGFDEALNKALEKLRVLLELPESGKRRDELMAAIGADALLEALKGKEDTQYGELESDVEANDHYFKIFRIDGEKAGEMIWKLHEGETGWLVFIPEEQQNVATEACLNEPKGPAVVG